MRTLPQGKDYLKNLGKSALFGGKALLGEIMPNTKNLINDTTSMTKETYDKYKNVKIDTGDNSGQFAKSYKRVIDNALSELKSGKFITKDSEDKKSDILMKSIMGDDIGSVLGDIDNLLRDDYEDKDETVFKDTEDTSSNEVDGTTVIKKNNNRVMMRTITNNVRLGSSKDQKITNQLLLTNLKTVSASIQASTSAILSGMSNIERFQNEVTRVFYNDMNSKVTDIYNSINIMSRAYQEVEENKYTSKEQELKNNLMYSGSIVSSIVDIIKYNTTQNKENNEFFTNAFKGMFDTFAENPMGTAMKTGMKGIIPKKLLGSMSRLDDTIGGLPLNMQYMFANWKDSDQTTKIFGKDVKLKQMLGKSLGIDLGNRKEISTGKFNKGAMSWNGIANRALVNVIPSLLSKILSAVTDNVSYKDELIYDYDKGKFTNKSTVKEETNRKFKDAVKDRTKMTADDIFSTLNEENMTEENMQELQSVIYKMARDGKNVSNYKNGSLSKNKEIEKALREYTKNSRNNNKLNRDLFESSRALQSEYDSFSDSRNIAGQMSIDYSSRGLYKRNRYEQEAYNMEERKKEQKRRRQESIYNATQDDEKGSKFGGKFASILDSVNDKLTSFTNYYDVSNDTSKESKSSTSTKYNKYKDKVNKAFETVTGKTVEEYEDSKATNHYAPKYNPKPLRNNMSGDFVKAKSPSGSVAGVPYSSMTGESSSKFILKTINDIINGEKSIHAIIDEGTIDRIRETVKTDEEENVNHNAAYESAKAKIASETEENLQGKEANETDAINLGNKQNSRLSQFEERRNQLLSNLTTNVTNMVKDSRLGQFVGQKKLDMKTKLSNTKVGKVFGKFFSTPSAVEDAGMTPVYIMGSSVELGGNDNSGDLSTPENRKSFKQKMMNLTDKTTTIGGYGVSSLGNLASRGGQALASKGGILGKIGNVLNTSGSALNTAGQGMQNFKSEEAIESMKFKRAEARETLKDKSEIAREKLKDLWANKGEIARQAIEKTQTMAREAKKSVIELSGTGQREGIKMAGAKAMEILKKGWELARQGAGTVMELAGKGIRSLAIASSGIPVAGPGIATAGVIAGTALLGITVAGLIKKFSKAKDKPPTAGDSLDVSKGFGKDGKNINDKGEEYADGSVVTDEPVNSAKNDGKEKKKTKLDKLMTLMSGAGGTAGIMLSTLLQTKASKQNEEYSGRLTIGEVLDRKMTPVWIMGSNIDTTNPTIKSHELAKEKHDEEVDKLEANKRDKGKLSALDKLSFNVRGLVRGFTSAFKGGNNISGGSSSSSSTSGGTSSNGYTTSSGSDNKSRVWNFLKQKGLSDAAVAGIMGNMNQESRFDPTASEHKNSGRDGSGGYGLIQWTGPRRKALFDAAQEQGKDVNDIDFQLNFLWDEVFKEGTYYRPKLDAVNFMNETDPANAAYQFHKIVEGSADTPAMIEKNRINPAKEYYAEYKGTTTGTSTVTGSTNVNTGSGSVIGGTSSILGGQNETSGTPVGGAMTSIDNAVAWAVGIADDESHGYSQAVRWGPDYDCSSLIISAYQQAGIPVKDSGAGSTHNMYSTFTANGFTDVTDITNHGTVLGALQKGDVLLDPASHTEMYIGDGKIVGAHSSETGGIYGEIGDQTGKEISVTDFYGKSWQHVLRAPGGFTAGVAGNGGNNNNQGNSTSNTNGTLGIFDSTYPITEEEKAQVEAKEYLDKAIADGTFTFQSKVIDPKKVGTDFNFKNPNATKLPSGMNASGYVASVANSAYTNYRDPNNINNSIINNASPGSGLIDRIESSTAGTIIGDGGSFDDITDGSGGTIVFPDNKPDNKPDTGDGSTNVPDDGGSGGNITPLPPIATNTYYEKVLKFLNLIEDHTSHIPTTNTILNEILEMIKNKENNSTILPNVNKSESIFDELDGDIKLIASGV